MLSIDYLSSLRKMLSSFNLQYRGANGLYYWTGKEMQLATNEERADEEATYFAGERLISEYYMAFDHLKRVTPALHINDWSLSIGVVKVS